MRNYLDNNDSKSKPNLSWDLLLLNSQLTKLTQARVVPLSDAINSFLSMKNLEYSTFYCSFIYFMKKL